MSNEELNKHKIKDHIYDGIEELDYGPPTWFNALFLITIAFGIIYFFYYSFGNGLTQKQEYEKEKLAMEVISHEQGGGSVKSPQENELFALIKDPEKLEEGKVIFQAKCMSCHGALGEGGIGPNLTDIYWLHGGKIENIWNVIASGVLDKGMPPWGSVLAPKEINLLTSYVYSLKGSTPPGAKAPQGEKL